MKCEVLLFCAILCLSSSEGEVITIPLKMGSADFHPSWVNNRWKRDSEENSNLVGKTGQGYYMEVAFGTPPQILNILIDTGSANFAVAAAPDPDITRYFHSNESITYKGGRTTVYVPYTQGNWEGILGTDVVAIPSVISVSIQPNIVFIQKSKNFFINTSDWQGIIGFAYKKIARPDSSLEPFLDTLVKERHIKDVFSVQLCGVPLPYNQSVNMHGTLVLGDIKSNLYEGEIFYTPLYKKWYYEVIMTDIFVGEESLSMDCKEYNYDKTIVDTGTTNLRFPVKVFKAVVSRIKKALKLQEGVPEEEFWAGDQVMCWRNLIIPFSAFPMISISLLLNRTHYFRLYLSPRHYLRAVANPDQSLSDNCFKFAISSSDSGSVLGAVFIEGFYVVFDRENEKIGFAKTTCKRQPYYYSLIGAFVEGPFTSGADLSECAYKKIERGYVMTLVVAYVMAAVCVLGFVPLLVMVVYYKVQQYRCKSETDVRPDSENLVEERPP